MKKLLSMVLVIVFSVSGMYALPIFTEAAENQPVYEECYGNQLGQEDSLSRYFYDQMVQNYVYQENDPENENGKFTGLAKPVTGDGSFIVEHDSFTTKTYLNSGDELTEYLNEWSKTEIIRIHDALRDAFDAFAKDYPQVYWIETLNTTVEFSGETKTVQGKVEATVTAKVTLRPQEYEDGMIEAVSDFNNSVCRVKNSLITQFGITTETKKEDIVRYIHDFVATEVNYNFEAASNPDSKDFGYAHTPFPVFLSSSAWSDLVMCEGYSKAFMILCQQFGIETALMLGDSTNPQGKIETHMWNAVKISDNWYAVDVAWDDQEDRIHYDYFLSGKKSKGFYDIYENDHKATGVFSSYENSKEFAIPQICETGLWRGADETESHEDITRPGETTTAQSGPENSGSDADHNKQTYHWVLKGLKNVGYTGKHITQNLQLLCDGKMITEGVDYRISYKNNINVGKAEVIITPIGRYKNAKPSTFSYNFNITKASITKAVIRKIKAQKYKKGKAVKPAVKLKYKGIKLKKGKDYKISYKNNKKKGTAKIVIKGKGNFKGKKIIKFKIK